MKFCSQGRRETMAIVRFKCTFAPSSLQNLRFWSPYFENSTFGPQVYAPLQKHGSL
ncbi:hypothetical protein MTR_3g046875 [Medicago truncatula]|uniref:Uncharacterized protein n=1 Tax=Medicago truncatula TaxID=3880 RepID=A0A072UVX4_MEDTR|nr:hypothetical protein MTR_3g046875 [Medicago truncatula]